MTDTEINKITDNSNESLEELPNSDSLLSDYTAFEIEEVKNRMIEVFGSEGALLAVGFQSDESFLDTFGSQYS